MLVHSTKKNRTLKIIAIVALALLFTLLLFQSNLEYVFNLGIQAIENESKGCVCPGINGEPAGGTTELLSHSPPMTPLTFPYTYPVTTTTQIPYPVISPSHNFLVSWNKSFTMVQTRGMAMES